LRLARAVHPLADVFTAHAVAHEEELVIRVLVRHAFQKFERMDAEQIPRFHQGSLPIAAAMSMVLQARKLEPAARTSSLLQHLTLTFRIWDS